MYKDTTYSVFLIFSKKVSSISQSFIPFAVYIHLWYGVLVDYGLFHRHGNYFFDILLNQYTYGVT